LRGYVSCGRDRSFDPAEHVPEGFNSYLCDNTSAVMPVHNNLLVADGPAGLQGNGHRALVGRKRPTVWLAKPSCRAEPVFSVSETRRSPPELGCAPVEANNHAIGRTDVDGTWNGIERGLIEFDEGLICRVHEAGINDFGGTHAFPLPQPKKQFVT
jgi:hypothetical protein